MIEIREASPNDLVSLPELEERSDTLFASLGIGPLAPPGSIDALSEALIVLVSGQPPEGFARVDLVAGGAHLEQLSVDVEHMRKGIGRALVRAACQWARDGGYREITLATYRDVPWNGPFYESEGFVESGPVDDWYISEGLDPEEQVLSRFGARVLMRRAL
jgi:GNAT superfamily N-acetyltransferase